VGHETSRFSLFLERALIDRLTFRPVAAIAQRKRAARKILDSNLLICPSCYYVAVIPVDLEGKSPAHIASSRASRRGAFRDRHERWCGMRWDAKALLTNGAEADGQVVWS
jgi:hypothetical protein